MYEENRPDPDEILSSLIDEEEKSKRGKMKIFFGMCAGVGKTYTMLEAAHVEKNKGKDIIIGYLETHDRRETVEIASGFEVIPRIKYAYKSTNFEEPDLDRILSRKPQIVIMDELAHSNAPGSRHNKRYQDIREILDSGIDVYTTLNVQHLESRSDTVGQITGIVVRETIPDDIFENADEIELVDLTPDELIQRLKDGKVYTAHQSEQAVANFFRKGNITALREMALRIVADRVDKQLHVYMQQKRIRGPWKSGMSFLVAVDYKSQSTRLLRWSKNLAYSLGASIEAIYVETAHHLNEKEREQLDKNINLARHLGIKFRIITNYDIVRAIVDFALKENITHIIVGKPRIRNFPSMLQLGNMVNRLIKFSGNIDIYVLGNDIRSKDKFRKKLTMPSFSPDISQYLMSTFAVILASVLCFALKNYIGYQVVSFVLLFLVSILALFFGAGPILLAAGLSAAIWDFLFIEPPFTLHIENPVDVLMLIMFFIIALLNGILTSRVRYQEKKIRVREERTDALYQLTRELSVASDINEVHDIVIHSIRKNFGLQSAVFLKDVHNNLENKSKGKSELEFSDHDKSIISWVFRQSSIAGKYTETLPSTTYTFYPLTGMNIKMGVIAVVHTRKFTQGESRFWEAFISQISGIFEREYLREAAKSAFVLNESDKLYKTLFNSISHELRIPVATIMGASDSLLFQSFEKETRVNLYHEINKASVRLNKLIDNLLNMSRLESGRITAHPDWCDVHDIVNKVIDNLKQELEPFNISVVISEDMPLVLIDFGMTEQILHNLVLNATQYSSPGTNIRIKFYYDNGMLIIQVMDRGKGFSESDLKVAFDKFYRGKDAVAGGTGLGLSIVKGFTEAQKGSVKVENRQNGGAVFTIKIPSKIPDIKSMEKDQD